MVELPASVGSQQGPGNKAAKAYLNSADVVFAELRDMIFNKVGPYLARKAKSLKNEYEGRVLDHMLFMN